MDDYKRKYELAKSRADRLKKAARQSELLLEQKSLELYKANQKLEESKDYLQEEIVQATQELQVANQRLMKALEEKSHLMASISHEIRTPLNAIVGYSELIESRLLEGETKEQIQIVSQSAASMMSLLNDILEITQIDVGKIHIKPVVTNTNDNLAFIGKMFDLQMQDKGLKWEMRSENLPEFINIDVRRYNQIVTNLVSNAYKYTEKGSVNFTCSFELDDDDLVHGWLTTVVTDTGLGIAPSQMETIFDLYEQAPDSNITSSQYSKRRQDDDVALHSLGLGLPICKSLCGLMLGEISCESRLGQGSKFVFKVPVSISSKDEVLARYSREPVEKAQSALKILVADDNLLNQQVIQAQLSQLNQQADIVSDGKQALDLLQGNSYDIVFLDILMPVMGGEETIIAIRKAEERIAKHFCVALTAASYQEKGQHLMEMGFDLFVSKPLTLKVLSDILSDVEVKKAEAALAEGVFEGESDVEGDDKEHKDNFDLSFFAEQFGKDANQIFCKIAPTFINSSLQRVDLLTQAIEAGDLEKIQFEAHTMKGEALTFGFTQLAEQLLLLEKAQTIVKAEFIFDDMNSVLETLTVQVKNKLMELS